ncbi:hypothetical protein CRG98_010693 [Punica granatum]|uniref:Uncharacterized protein n=1 Tax=Punica granatum TaxID=22663 RepID=A0A2I0KKQ8_PUNGR|nr:hypothetical protein CRG98_010693 [Punica granatum]
MTLSCAGSAGWPYVCIGDALIVYECICKAVVLTIGLTLGIATRLVAWESENRGWFTCRDRHDYPLVVITERAKCPEGGGCPKDAHLLEIDTL